MNDSPRYFYKLLQNRSKKEIFINISWKHSSGNWFLLLNITFQFARWLPNHLQYPPLGQVWSHGNWTRIGNCWENQEHARASPRWKITLDFFFYFFGILLLKLFWPTVRKSCSSDREKLLKFGAEGQEFSKILKLLEQFIQTAKGQNNFW